MPCVPKHHVVAGRWGLVPSHNDSEEVLRVRGAAIGRQWLSVAALGTVALIATGCLFDGTPLQRISCDRDIQCARGQICVEGYCSPADEDPTNNDIPPSGCQTDAQCDDGVFCNGVETCAPQNPEANALGCLAGQVPAVDDGVECTEDICDALTDTPRHIPTDACQCQTDADCPADDDPCLSGFCNDAFECDVLQAPAGTSCDDGIPCTGDDACSPEGTCSGAPDDARCSDGAFCNGAELCAPGTGADEEGCIPGLAPNPPDDLPDCALARCDEAQGGFVINDSACLCLQDEDCQGPCVVEGRCEAGQCVRTLARAGTPCDDQDGVYCTAGSCDAQGTCAPTAQDELCRAPCRVGAACDPANANSLDGCRYDAAAEGLSCTIECGPLSQDGVCLDGQCTPAAPRAPSEASAGHPFCADGLDNDCDGTTDEGDTGCATPDTIALRAPATGPSGLGTGVVVEVEVSAAGQKLTQQTDRIYCNGRAVGPGVRFESTAALGSPDLTFYDPQGQETRQIEGHITPATAFEAGTGDATGATICDGYSVSWGPFLMPPLVGDVRTYVFSVTAGTPLLEGFEPGLGADDRLLISYRTQNGLNGQKFVPVLAIDAQDRSLETYDFVVRNGGGVGTLEIRVDLLSDSPQGRCGYVQGIQLYEVINPGPGVQRTLWDVSDIGRLSIEGFAGATESFLDGFFSPAPEENHVLGLSPDALTTPPQGVTWRLDTQRGFVELPRPRAIAQQAPGSPLIFHYNAALPGGDPQDTVHFYASAEQGRGARKMASMIGAAALPDHLTTSYNYIERTMVILPEAARPLDDLRLRMARDANPQVAAFMDSFDLYYLTPQGQREVVSTPATAAPESPIHQLTVRSARPGPVEVRCHWQNPAQPGATLSSEPVIVGFQ